MASSTLVTSIGAQATTSGAKRTAVDTIIVHAISGPDTRCPGGKMAFSGAPGDADRWKSFFDKHPFLGIHYVVDRDGKVDASTPESRVANHALDNNDTSIGIELVHDGDGTEPFENAQIDALIGLLRSIRSRHDVAIENIRGHADVDARTFRCEGRVQKTKMDPGANFPWERVRAALEPKPKPQIASMPAAAPEPRLLAEPKLLAVVPSNSRASRQPPYGLNGPDPAPEPSRAIQPGAKPEILSVTTKAIPN